MMQAYFGTKRFSEIRQAFLETIIGPDHRSTSVVVMVQAERPL